jgi:hypothetical protein
VNHDTIITNNTIAASGRSSIVVGGDGGVSNITIRNNILYDDDWGVEIDSTCPTGVVIDHNDIAAYKSGPVEPGCTDVSTGAGNVVSDPLFTNFANRDLHLLAGSPAIDQALPSYSELVDFDGTSRPRGAAPDIGAYESS